MAVNFGVVDEHIWSFFWPATLVLLGAWFLLRPKRQLTPLSVEKASYPVNSATEAEISIHYGAGSLTIRDSNNLDELAGGAFTGGVVAERSDTGSKAVLALRTPSDRVFQRPWPAGEKGFEWNLVINGQIPVNLQMHTGANELMLDLSRTQVKNLALETGASHSVIILPQAAGFSHATIKSGLADVNINIPAGVAAAIHVTSGLSGIKVDEARFLRSGELYQSADYQTAVNKVEITVESGLGSVSIQ